MKLDSTRATLAIIVVLYALFINFQLEKSQYDPSYFVVAGDLQVDHTVAPETLKVLRNSAGYDGQYYYRLAITPFTSKQIDLGIKIDQPAYRQQRIVYPLLAWLFSLGQPSIVPLSLILVNCLALCLITWLGTKYAQTAHHHAFWGLIFPLFPGFLLTLSRDLTEIVDISFLLGVIVCVQQNRRLLAIILLVLAVLTRETAIVVAIGGLLSYVFVKRQAKDKFFLFFAFGPIFIYALWRVWLTYNWTSFPFSSGFKVVGLPFVGVSQFLQRIMLPTNQYQWVLLIELILILIFTLAILSVLHRSTARTYIKVSWVLYLSLAVSLAQFMWNHDWAFLRVLSEFYVLGSVIFLESQSPLKKWIFGGIIASWLFLATDIILMR